MAWTPQLGEVVPYSFLWAHESALGEDAGRKLRPCVIVVAVRRLGPDAWRVAVAPITTQHNPSRALIEMPQAVKRHLKLDERPSWVVCDELNKFEWPGFDLGRTPSGQHSYGFVPDPLSRRILAAIVARNEKGGLKITSRD